jgi:hypothetical protein
MISGYDTLDLPEIGDRADERHGGREASHGNQGGL